MKKALMVINEELEIWMQDSEARSIATTDSHQPVGPTTETALKTSTDDNSRPLFDEIFGSEGESNKKCRTKNVALKSPRLILCWDNS